MRPKRKTKPPKEFPLVGGGGVKMKAQVCMEARKRKKKEKQNGEGYKARVGKATVRHKR